MGRQDFTCVRGRTSDGVTLSRCLPISGPLFPDLCKDRVGQDALGGLFNLQFCLESSSLALDQTGDSWRTGWYRLSPTPPRARTPNNRPGSFTHSTGARGREVKVEEDYTDALTSFLSKAV